MAAALTHCDQAIASAGGGVEKETHVTATLRSCFDFLVRVGKEGLGGAKKGGGVMGVGVEMEVFNQLKLLLPHDEVLCVWCVYL